MPAAASPVAAKHYECSTARAGTFSDQVTRTVTVQPRGFPQKFSKGGLLSQAAPFATTVTLPPLRARRVDIPLLIDSLLPRCARRAGLRHRPTIDAEAIAASKIVLLEGYLFDRPEAKAAFRRAAKDARVSQLAVDLGTLQGSMTDYAIGAQASYAQKTFVDGKLTREERIVHAVAAAAPVTVVMDEQLQVVDDDQPSDVSEPELAGDLGRCLESHQYDTEKVYRNRRRNLALRPAGPPLHLRHQHQVLNAPFVLKRVLRRVGSGLRRGPLLSR